ncbi:glycosyltransferase involved in cell wall biosynthesis [Nocardiopsis sp. Huas11]|uniref:glycosyltransferase n=1 Tax=Nocardiopsis sp. Huas11 TaxID=2183912 RepID=UPI000EB59BF1|nr:glycosyltransferase family A protein [Nocardiopsis sp. Huas11]RKS10752.1 glycosyltransferase involved in cell wall biosynthesis [Nocardiopsis sp. Huas11]
MSDGDIAHALDGRGPGHLLACHVGPLSAAALRRAGLGPDAEVVDLGGPREPAGERTVDHVALVADSTADLCAAVPLAEGLPSASEVTVVVRAAAAHFGPPCPVPPGLGRWEGVIDARVRRLPDGGWSCALSFSDPMEVAEVAAAVARGMLGVRRGALARPADGADGAGDGDGAGTGPGPRPGARAVARSWASLGRPGALTGAEGGAPFRLSVADVPAVDERVVNPVGFTRESKNKRGRLVSRSGRWVLEVGRSVRWRVPEDGAVTDVAVERLRNLRSVEMEWGRHSGPLAAVRAVAGLAAAGTPLVSGPVPRWADCLGSEVSRIITSVDARALADAQVREEHSIRLRRAALRLHGASARWRRSVSGAGAEPAVSVVLCTRRPEMVGFALRQVARQRGVDVEVVLALHGFGAHAPGVPEAVDAFHRSGRPLTVWECDAATVFGSVLNGAIARTSGSLVAKMDDDDWYGPDHLADLVLARRYSGADLVGSIASFVYLEALDLTVRLPGATECPYVRVAGGTMLTDRRVLEEVGGFRAVPTGEDSRLLADLGRLGAHVHRGHGCNYVLRRKAAGHTWGVGSGYFLRHGNGGRLPGWRPSALLEPDPVDAPATRSAAPWSVPREPGPGRSGPAGRLLAVGAAR